MIDLSTSSYFPVQKRVRPQARTAAHAHDDAHAHVVPVYVFFSPPVGRAFREWPRAQRAAQALGRLHIHLNPKPAAFSGGRQKLQKVAQASSLQLEFLHFFMPLRLR